MTCPQCTRLSCTEGRAGPPPLRAGSSFLRYAERAVACPFRQWLLFFAQKRMCHRSTVRRNGGTSVCVCVCVCVVCQYLHMYTYCKADVPPFHHPSGYRAAVLAARVLPCYRGQAPLRAGSSFLRYAERAVTPPFKRSG